MTSAGSNPEFTTSGENSSGENSSTALPEQLVSITQNIVRSCRFRPSTNLPLDLMNTKVSEISSEKQSGDTENISTIDLTSSGTHSSVHYSTTNSSNFRKDPIRKLIRKKSKSRNKKKILTIEQRNSHLFKELPKAQCF